MSEDAVRHDDAAAVIDDRPDVESAEEAELVVLRSRSGHAFQLPRNIADVTFLSADAEPSNHDDEARCISLDLSSFELERIVAFARYHANAPDGSEVAEWDRCFVADLGVADLVAIMCAAHLLRMGALGMLTRCRMTELISECASVP